MERVFTRATHSTLQPVEISKRLVRAMESEQSVSVDGVIVPNVYDIFLSPEDWEQYAPAERSHRMKMEAHLARTARAKRYHMMSRPVVHIEKDRRLSRGDFRVVPHLQDVDQSEVELPPVQHTAILPALAIAPIPGAGLSRPTLRLNGQAHAVLRSPTRLGRLPDNDIVIGDNRVSRHHAEVLESGNRWLVRDMGSKNGTTVNGRIVKEAALKPGDVISLGGVEATWEQ